MTNVTPLKRETASNADVIAVADEVRGVLAKRRIATYKLPELLRDGSSRGYWQRRVSGDLAFDINDLSQIARLCGVTIADLIPAQPRPLSPDTKKAPTADGEGLLLPDLDSNQEPAG
jgi:hypothetical protein